MAYKEMAPSAAKALPYFVGKVKTRFDDPQRYKMEFSFSYSEALTLGFAKATFSGVIRELIRYGFIDPIEKGGLRGLCRSSSIFRLSERWGSYGKPEFKPIEWRSFEPKKD